MRAYAAAMCGDCWNATMAAPAVAVAARFAWVGHRDRIPFLRGTASDAAAIAPTDAEPAHAEPGDDAPGEGVRAADADPVARDDRDLAPVP